MTYSWLAENFTKEGQSTGLYMACQVNMTVTADANAARTFRRQEFAWAAVSEAFALGSTFSQQLLRRFGFDPDSGKKV